MAITATSRHGIIMGLFNKAKTLAAQATARKYLNGKFQELGVVTKLEIDSEKKTFHLEAELRGEPNPVTITVDRYRFIESEGKSYIEVLQATISREWMNALAERFIQGKRFEVPQAVRLVL